MGALATFYDSAAKTFQQKLSSVILVWLVERNDWLGWMTRIRASWLLLCVPPAEHQIPLSDRALGDVTIEDESVK